MPLKKSFGAGVQLAYWSQVDTRGHMTAWDGTTTTGPTSSGMRQFVGIKSANPAPVEPEFPLITGDDGPIGRIDFGTNETPNWIMEIAVSDLDADGALQGTTPHAIGDAYFNSFQPLDAVYPDICLIYNSKAKNHPTSTKAWRSLLCPIVTAVPLDRDNYQERTPAVYKYKLLANPAVKYPWGVTITEAIAGTAQTIGFVVQSDNPIICHRLTGDGSNTTFNVPKAPISTAKTIVYAGNGLLTALASVSPSGKTITFGSIPANGQELQVFMEFTP